MYFYASFLAYFLGLLLTILVMHFFKHAQVSENFFVNLIFYVLNFISIDFIDKINVFVQMIVLWNNQTCTNCKGWNIWLLYFFSSKDF